MTDALTLAQRIAERHPTTENIAAMHAACKAHNAARLRALARCPEDDAPKGYAPGAECCAKSPEGPEEIAL